MKLKKVIEILDLNIKEAGRSMPPDVLAALKLSVESTKFRQRWEEQEGEDDFPLLPGEDPP